MVYVLNRLPLYYFTTITVLFPRSIIWRSCTAWCGPMVLMCGGCTMVLLGIDREEPLNETETTMQQRELPREQRREYVQPWAGLQQLGGADNGKVWRFAQME